jgi:tripartite-type tricarboxylate transporter receptor subunit TctC
MGGTIAAETAFRTAPDGYNLLMGSTGALAVGPAVMKVGFDPIKDFSPIALIATTPYVLVVNSRLPIHSLAELIAYAKLHPGKMNFGSSGTGSTDHIAGEVLQKMAGIKFTHIPYKGIGPLLPDLLSGRLDVAILSPIPFKASSSTGQLRALGVTTKQRSPALEGVPSIAEQGFPTYDLYAWYGFLAPAGTPTAVVNRMNAATMKALSNKDVAAYLKSQGLTAGKGSPTEFAHFVKSEIALWQHLVELTGVTIQ